MDADGRRARTLATDLRARTDNELAALLSERPDLAAPLPADLAGLAARASTRTSILRAIDGLDAAGWHVVQGLLVLDDLVSDTELRAVLGSPPDAALRPVLDRLRTVALVWGPDDALQVPRSLRELGGDYPAGLGPPAYPLLISQGASRVAAIAAATGLQPTGQLTADAAAVSRLLGSDSGITRLLAEIDDAARGALGQLTWGPPVGRVPDAQRALGPAHAGSTIDQLLARGLLIPAGGDRVLMPREVGLHLRGRRVADSAALIPPAIDVVPRDPGLVDRTAAGAAATLVGHVSSLLDRWGLTPPTELRAGGLAVRDVRAAARALDLDEAGAALVAEVAWAAGLLASSGEVEPVWLPTAEYDRWRELGTSQRWAELATAWLSSAQVSGLAGTHDERGRRLAPLSADLTRASAVLVRGDVLTAMATTTPGAAPQLTSLLAAVTWRAPRRGGQLLPSLVEWTVREAAQLGVTGMGALASHGRALLAEADVSTGANVAGAGRSTGRAGAAPAAPGAAAALEPLLPRPVDYVLMQADLTAVAPGPLVPELAESLALAAEVESTGGATVYRFTAGSLRRAFDAGRSAEDVHRLLADASRTPVPQPLDYLVDDVARRHGRIRVSTVRSVVRLDDETAADQLLGDRSMAPLGLRRLAATVLCSERPAQAVVDVMRDGGYSPVVEGPGGELVVRRLTSRRAPANRRTPWVRLDRARPAPAVLAAAVRTLRAGDRVSTARSPVGGTNGAARPPLVSRRPVDTIAVLTDALSARQPVWIGYVDNNGTSSERLVDPIRVEGGWLTAYDHARDDVRTFAAHRITGVSVMEDSGTANRITALRAEEHTAR